MRQLEAVSATLERQRNRNVSLSDNVDGVSSECAKVDHHCGALVLDPERESTAAVPASHVSGDADTFSVPASKWWSGPTVVSPPQVQRGQVKFQYPTTGVDQKLQKAEQRLLSTISAHSSSLAEMMTTRCDSEMARTRALDVVVDTATAAVGRKTKQLAEIEEIKTQLIDIRKEFDAQLVDDFNTLVDLALTVESLESELVKERRSQKKQENSCGVRAKFSNKAVVVPIRESTIQLQARVDALSAELATKEDYYKTELNRLQSQLGHIKSRKIRSKSHFQQSLKSIFKDVEFLTERVSKSESALEKVNIHYQLDESEIAHVVAPIIDSIDGVKERLDALSTEAEQALYGTTDQTVYGTEGSRHNSAID